MNRIKTRINRETNYVYHMLSVAKCGYDNAYGEKHRALHDAADLSVLKARESLITVAGGEHNGALYWPMVAIPARGEQCADAYYAELCGIFQGRAARPEIFPFGLSERYAEHREAVVELSRVMLRNYGVYVNRVWEGAQRELAPYAAEIGRLFEKSGFTEKAERLVGQDLGTDAFCATFCNAIASGAEGVDIADDQDVFGIDRSFEDAFYFIAHEYIIFLLKRALTGTEAFQSIGAWARTEGLAEFYLNCALGKGHLFRAQEKYAAHYRRLFEANGALSARELFSAEI
ncbi:MAG: hypothetical protein ABFC62_07340 [Clostridiaceae bacterium]